jgi:uracil-DNA glycosylase family 4
MYPVLYRAGFASQPNATHINDGLKLHDAYITAAVRCAPPGNKPLPEEIATCAEYLDRELALLKNVRVVVALGRIGFEAYLNHLKRRGLIRSRAPYVFGHGRHYTMPDGRILLASFHPSMQNTNTGKLTEAMFLDIFRLARRLADGVGAGSAATPPAARRSKAGDRPDRGSSRPTRGRSRSVAR